MWIEIEHRTRFRYDRPVFLEPIDVRLRPRANANQVLALFDLEIAPRPVGLDEHDDLFGNGVARAWFDGVHESLTITTRAAVETLRVDPFAGLVDPVARRLPFVPPPDIGPTFTAYSARDPADLAVTELAMAWAREVGGETVSFLSEVARRLHEQWRPLSRPEGEPLPPSVTLVAREGSCRDLAVLHIDLCRAVGLAARFVSGYHATSTAAEGNTLHAWCEVYLPGAGWLGFDPSEGLAVGDRHVAVAVGTCSRDAAPTVGTFRGTGAQATLEAEVRLQVRAERPAGEATGS